MSRNTQRVSRMDRTALSYWFPKIAAAGLPVPKTRLVEMNAAAQEDVFSALDGKDGSGAATAFFADLEKAAAEIGYPCFLRTDHTSGKHSWEKTCYLPSAADIPQHVHALAEFSEMCDFIGLPWDVWAVRELLPTIPDGQCPRYGHMPICREFRFFVNEGQVLCSHPYWPRQALIDGGASDGLDYVRLCRLGGAEEELRVLAELAGRAVGGAWSVDILETRRGWFVTDMAEAARSFHWEGCTATPSGTPSVSEPIS